MADKRKRAPTATARRKKGSVSSLQSTPAQRLADLEKHAAAEGIKPMEDYDRFLEEVGDVWPKDENLDDFLAWLYKSRQEERSRSCLP